jgi:hypothetical protein
MDDTRYLLQTKQELKRIFRPREEIMQKAETMMDGIRQQADMVVGVHVRHGDYKTFRNGRYYYTIEEFRQFMLRIKQLYADRRVAFFISSNGNFSLDEFEGCLCFRHGKEPSGDILDLYTLSLCDRMLGPWSTYSRWASFIGDVPLCFIERRDQTFTEHSFSVVTDFYHFADGRSTEDYWNQNV